MTIDQEDEHLTIDTDGEWTAEEFSALLRSVSTIYDGLLSFQTVKDLEAKIPKGFPRPTVSEIYSHIDDFVGGTNRLRVDQVSLGSPTFLMLVGTALVIAELRKLLVAICAMILVQKDGTIPDLYELFGKMLDPIKIASPEAEKVFREMVVSAKEFIALLSKRKPQIDNGGHQHSGTTAKNVRKTKREK